MTNELMQIYVLERVRCIDVCLFVLFLRACVCACMRAYVNYVNAHTLTRYVISSQLPS